MPFVAGPSVIITHFFSAIASRYVLMPDAAIESAEIGNTTNLDCAMYRIHDDMLPSSCSIVILVDVVCPEDTSLSVSGIGVTITTSTASPRTACARVCQSLRETPPENI